MQLLNIDANPKTIKGRRKGYVTAVLYLSPADSSGTELCGMAEIAGCKVGCLNTAGRGGMAKGSATFIAANGETLPDNAIQKARLARTTFFLSDQSAFMERLVKEIERAKRYARRKRKRLVVRLNGTSDIRWESIPCIRRGKPFANAFAAFPELQFYDYTKLPNRRVAGIPNYHLTFSYSHREEFAPIVAKAVRYYGAAVNFAAVFKKAIPAYFLGRRVVNGDESDLRFLDRRNVVVGLIAKGKARRDTSGFVVPAIA
jgi:hypothetical protein